ncbi:MAG: hypothetical protein V9H69_26390 [Anaerolineae bacterium]
MLTIGNTGAAAPGSYSIEVMGVAVTSTHTTTVGLNVFTAAPAGPTLLTPANGALNVPAAPTFTWNAVAQAASYSIQVATDAGFSNIVASATGIAGTSWTSNVALNTSSTYYWRVWADNTCGAGAYSATWSFTTVAAPGDCSPGTTPRVLFSDGFESGVERLDHPGRRGRPTPGRISTANPNAGAQPLRAAWTRPRSPTSGWCRRLWRCPRARTRWC